MSTDRRLLEVNSVWGQHGACAAQSPKPLPWPPRCASTSPILLRPPRRVARGEPSPARLKTSTASVVRQQSPQAIGHLRVVGRGPWLAAPLSWLQRGCCVKGAGGRRCHPLLAQGASPAIRCLRSCFAEQVLSDTSALRDSAGWSAVATSSRCTISFESGRPARSACSCRRCRSAQGIHGEGDAFRPPAQQNGWARGSRG